MLRRLSVWLVPAAITLAAPAVAIAATDLHGADPIKEFNPSSDELVHIQPFSWLNLSINKPVIYLFLTAILAVGGTVLILRGGFRERPGRMRTFAEVIYDFMETSIGRASLPERIFKTWFPYIATLFVFIWVGNLMSYIPLPIDTEHKAFGWLPGFSLYAATANLSVTLSLTLVTVVATHWVGIRQNGVKHYFKSWVPPAPGPLKVFLVPLEVLSQLLRIVLRSTSAHVRYDPGTLACVHVTRSRHR